MHSCRFQECQTLIRVEDCLRSFQRSLDHHCHCLLDKRECCHPEQESRPQQQNDNFLFYSAWYIKELNGTLNVKNHITDLKGPNIDLLSLKFLCAFECCISQPRPHWVKSHFNRWNGTKVKGSSCTTCMYWYKVQVHVAIYMKLNLLDVLIFPLCVSIIQYVHFPFSLCPKINDLQLSLQFIVDE